MEYSQETIKRIRFNKAGGFMKWKDNFPKENRYFETDNWNRN